LKQVSWRDKVGGKLVGSDGYTGTVEPKPVTQWDSDTLAFAIERAGTYTLTLYKERYFDWTRSGIVVERDECHVMTVRLQAEMHPLDVVLTR